MTIIRFAAVAVLTLGKEMNGNDQIRNGFATKLVVKGIHDLRAKNLSNRILEFRTGFGEDHA